MRQTGLTHRNLSSHLSKLEDSDYLNVVKEFVGNKPHKMLLLTDKGRKVIQDYSKAMK